jgi:hypothetical protein
MRNSNYRHGLDKEMYSKLNSDKPPSRHQDRNPLFDDPSYPSPSYPSAEPVSSFKKKNRMLAKGDFSAKNQGSFALSYDTYEDYRPSKKCFNKEIEDPIKPPEFIPPANFKRPDRNPILDGDFYREPEARTRPDQVSQVFNSEPRHEADYDRRGY